MLVRGNFKLLADAAKPDAKGSRPRVRVRGALVHIPGARGMAKAVVVKDVEVMKPIPVKPFVPPADVATPNAKGQ